MTEIICPNCDCVMLAGDVCPECGTKDYTEVEKE